MDIEGYKYIQVWCRAVSLLKNHYGNEVYIRGNCDQAPFSLASLLRGTENWLTDLYMTDESLVMELLDFCQEATSGFIRLMAETGCDMVSNGDSPAGPDMIPPDLYEKFALPYEQNVAGVAHDMGVDYVLHICGNTDIILEQMIKTGADGLELDYKTNARLAFDILGETTTFFGNVDPSGVLALGTAEMVKEKTTELLDIFSGTNRFVLNSGCALPPNTPEENINTFIRTAREYESDPNRPCR